eukprot:NODE_3576_length_951_cov_10.323725_g3286_i0.p1 GENE.NODE_3576_length_951_cov_10.323725_g3286_i0~~NODE_3576_length_951_cov_10.323725_g3286_i0.p1  ORF type:complete len:280 (-),score=51.05 NODE_3576_length_951_cov_10.323725_g3286_i0:34-873(-)
MYQTTIAGDIRRVLDLLLADLGEASSLLDSVEPSELRSVLKTALTTYPHDPTEEVNTLMDRILQEELQRLHLVAVDNLRVSPTQKVALWKGDITLLRVDAIVNAANSAMLGCFQPNHPCIDNAIHCRAGPRLRAACRQLMLAQGTPEPTGSAKITPGFNLPAKFVVHTVGPIVSRVSSALSTAELAVPLEARMLLESCYRACLEVANEAGLRSIAFCCISTGVFGYPQKEAANVACATVKKWLDEPRTHGRSLEFVVFDVFLESDLEIYSELVPQIFGS